MTDIDPPMAAAIQRAVATTLRYISDWGAASEQELRRIADQVDLGPGWTFCPVCCEVQCDHDCPLAPIRGSEDDGEPRP